MNLDRARFRFLILGAAAALALVGPAASAPSGSRYAYPPSPRADVVDDYHGTRVADPFRPLENLDAPEVQAWIAAENAVTRTVLDRSRQPVRILDRLKSLNDYPKAGLPVEREGRIFYTMNEGLQNQSVQMVREGLEGEPRVLFDPNRLSADGTAAVARWKPSPDGRLVVYGVSEKGSDWEELHVLDVQTGQDLRDLIPWVKFVDPAWTEDGSGFYYGRQPAPGTVPAGDEHYYQKIYFHPIGGNFARDEVVYERPDLKEAISEPSVTEDGRFLVVTVYKGSAEETEIFVKPLGGGAGKNSGGRPGGRGSEFRPLFTGFDAAYVFAGALNGKLYFLTDRDAPRRRVISVDPDRPGSALTTVIPEGRDVLTSVTLAGGTLVVQALHDASDRVTVHEHDGKLRAEIRLPTLGAVGVSGRLESDLLFVSFTSFLFPTTIYRADLTGGALTPHFVPRIDFDRNAYVTRQIWYPSKDGTKVPMFLVHRRGISLDGDHPTLLTAYGGFNISETPGFSAARLFWLEEGGIYASANLRGGGEFGEEWHRAGMLEKKQNVFDDFIAAAEYLIDNGYTRPERLAIQGGSNGGLLTAAVTNQRPELFGASVIQVPVADMLRYHRFTVARFWIPEYGSAEDPAQFPFLYAYSPLHNVKPGTAYPAILITTGESDDRVHPGQVLKLAAALQEANGSDRPILLRVTTRAGHGGGKPTSKRLEEGADVYAFLHLALDMRGGWRARRGSGLGDLLGSH